MVSFLFAGMAEADYANNGIWLQAAYSGHQAWAYYPFDPANPFTGGSYSPIGNGTSYFIVAPGTSIFRKYIVLNNEPYNDSVDYVITGIPSSWGLIYTARNPLVLNYVQYPSVGLGAQKSHQGFGNMVVTVPAGTPPGTYKYTITATSGTGYTSTLTDSIVVGTGGSPPVTLTPTPTPASSISPSPSSGPSPSPAVSLTITPTPAPGAYKVSSTYRWAIYNNTYKPLEQFSVMPGTTVQQSIYYTNAGPTADSYSISISGIPASWYRITFIGPGIVNPGERRYANAFITPEASGSFPVVVSVTSNGDPSVSTSQPYILNVAGPADHGPTPTATSASTGTPTPAPSSSPLPDVNQLSDPGFESGTIDRGVWVGGQLSNYKNDQILVTPVAAHTGAYGAIGAKDAYCRAAQNVTYGGHGFNFSAWIYINPNELVGTSIWAGVLSVDAGNRASIDNTSYSRCVGYNDRSAPKMAQYQVGAGTGAYQNFMPVTTSGWYQGAITYDGATMTFRLFDSDGNLLRAATNAEAGFVPKAVVINVGSKSHYIDDLYYSTW